MLQTEAFPETRGQQDQLGFNIGTRHAESLGTKLMKLPVAPFLRAFMAKHRAVIPQPLLLIVQQAGLQTGTHNAGGVFRTQAQTVAVTIVETVHFLFNDIGNFTDGASEQSRFLNNRRANLTIAVRLYQRTILIFQMVPHGHVSRQNIVHSANNLKLISHRLLRSSHRH